MMRRLPNSGYPDSECSRAMLLAHQMLHGLSVSRQARRGRWDSACDIAQRVRGRGVAFYRQFRRAPRRWLRRGTIAWDVVSGPRGQNATTRIPATRLGRNACHRSCQTLAAHATKSLFDSPSVLTCALEHRVRAGCTPIRRRDSIAQGATGSSRQTGSS